MAKGESLLDKMKENKNLKIAGIAVGAVVVIILAYVSYNKFIYQPQNEKSKTIYWPEMAMVENDSLNLALDGFQAYAKKYDGKVGGEVSSYMAARILMDKGEFKQAIKYLEDTKLEDVYVGTMVLGLQGDCYSELGQYQDAVKYYEKAIDRKPNEMTTPRYLMKAALVYEMQLKEYTKAADNYKRIKNDYFEYSKTVNIDKYIERAANRK